MILLPGSSNINGFPKIHFGSRYLPFGEACFTAEAKCLRQVPKLTVSAHALDSDARDISCVANPTKRLYASIPPPPD